MKKKMKQKNLFTTLASSIFEENLNNPYALDQLMRYGRMCMEDSHVSEKEVYETIRQNLDSKYLPLLDMLVLLNAPDFA